MKTFICKFGRGVSCKLSVSDTAPLTSNSHILKVEWRGGKESRNQRLIKPYIRWVHTVNTCLANEWGVTLLHVFSDMDQIADVWVYKPKRKPEFVGRTAMDKVEAIAKGLNHPINVVQHGPA